MTDKYNKSSLDSILGYAETFQGSSLRELVNPDDITSIENKINIYNGRRKGLLGDVVEEYLFDIENNSDTAPDFKEVSLELKTSPIKINKNRTYSAKERLVFSMIDYMTIIDESWEESSFLKKNKYVLLLLYVYDELQSLLDYKFKVVEYIDLLNNFNKSDIEQIKQDWIFIVDKIRRGEAHLLSEGDTAYLGAATKASSSSVTRKQPNSDIPAKPRAFSLKTSYVNYLIKKFLNKTDKQAVSLNKNKKKPYTIEDIVNQKFQQYFNKLNTDIEKELGIVYEKRPKNHRRLLVNNILSSTGSNKIEEFEKANITIRVLALETSGILKESISFPKFAYTSIVNETWEESDFYEQLSIKRFLFVVFRKTKNGDILEKVKFWNFPMKDIEEAKWVWEETVNRIREKRADKLPTIKENKVAHVRPHGRNKDDTLETGYGTYEVKKCFWLNAKYVENEIRR